MHSGMFRELVMRRLHPPQSAIMCPFNVRGAQGTSASKPVVSKGPVPPVPLRQERTTPSALFSSPALRTQRSEVHIHPKPRPEDRF
jgi:hypothetical protein